MAQTVGRNIAAPLLFLNLLMYAIALGFASWCTNRYINGQTSHPSKPLSLSHLSHSSGLKYSKRLREKNEYIFKLKIGIITSSCVWLNSLNLQHVGVVAVLSSLLLLHCFLSGYGVNSFVWLIKKNNCQALEGMEQQDSS